MSFSAVRLTQTLKRYPTQMSSSNFIFTTLYVISILWLSTVRPTNAAAADKTVPVMLYDNVVLICPSQRIPSTGAIWMGPDGLAITTRGNLSASLDRAKYTIIPGSAGAASTLIINDVRLRDDGVYWCLDADSLKELRSINVTVLVQTISLTAPLGGINEGSDVKVRCVTDGSKPAPEIIWVKQDSGGTVTRVSGVNTDQVHANGTVQRTNTLTVPVDRSDYLASYTCRATVSVFSRQAVWKPDVYLSPTTPSLQSDRTTYSDGDTAHLQCITLGSRPAAGVTWFVRNKPITDASGQISHQDKEDEDGTFSSSSQLAIVVSRDTNGADVTCSVTNSVLTSEGKGARNASIAIVVEYPPIVSITSSTSEVALGEDVTFTCTADAEPPIVGDHVYLALNEHFLPEARLLRNGEQIILMNVSRFDGGQYQCVAQNKQGTTSSSPTSVSVRFAPFCMRYDVTTIYVSLGDVVSVPCPIKAFPHDVTVTWIRRSTNQTLRQKSVVRWSANGVAESDFRYTARFYGDIICYAKNSIGESTNPCVLQLIPPEPPSAPANCLVLTLSNSSRQVRCTPGGDGGSVQTFILRIREASVEENIVSGREPRFLLDDWENNADLNLTVCAVSKAFPDSPVCADTLLLHKDLSSVSSSSAFVGEKSTLYIVLGIVFGCCLIAVIVFVVVICRRRQGSHHMQKRERQPDSEDRGHQKMQNQREQEHSISLNEGTDHGSSAHEDNVHDVATAERALLASKASGADRSQDSRLSLRSSKSLSLADSVRSNPNTKVYVKVEKKDKNANEDTNESATEDDLHQHESAYKSGVNRENLSEDFSVAMENNGNDRSSGWRGEVGEGKENVGYTHEDHKRPIESGRNSPRNRPGSKSASACAIRGAENRVSDPVDHAAFSDMIRQILERNRSSLLPREHSLRRQSPASSPPLISLLGTSDFPYSVCVPSARPTSQTSLASDKPCQSSDIYDVPKSSSDWQRAMSLLSLSAIGSGVLFPDGENKDDYVDMTEGLRGGSVPDLDKVGVDPHHAYGDRGRSNYYRVPSNKHAYINLMYPHNKHQNADVHGIAKPGNGSIKRQESNLPLQLRPRTTRNEDSDKKRRWSSSEQKTHELMSFPPSTAILHPAKTSQPSANHTRYQPVRTSMKLSPAPRLKLYPGRTADPSGVNKETESNPSASDSSATTPRRGPESSNNSPTYIKMERSPQPVSGRFAFDGRVQEEASGKPASRISVEGSHSLKRQRGRPRLPSVRRNPSYSQAVTARETTGYEKEGERSRRFLVCMEDYVIIPTPSHSGSSTENSPREEKESYC